jgi:hypothetical protein
VLQEEENLLRDIIRSIDKKVDYSSREGEGTKFSIHMKLRGHEADILGLKPEKILRAAPKPEPIPQRSSFGRGSPRR